MFKKLFAFLASIFGGTSAPANSNPVPKPPVDGPMQPPVKYPTDRETYLRNRLVSFWLADEGQTEDRGSNRSKMIDAVNIRIGSGLGAAYCIAGLVVRGVEALCRELNLVNPIPMTGSTQKFYNKSYLNGTQFCIPKGKGFAKKGCIGILVNKNDKDHGHAFGHAKDETSTQQSTIEYNTDLKGDANGDGVYQLARQQSGTSSKEFRGSVDVVAWLLHANPDFQVPIDNKLN